MVAGAGPVLLAPPGEPARSSLGGDRPSLPRRDSSFRHGHKRSLAGSFRDNGCQLRRVQTVKHTRARETSLPAAEAPAPTGLFGGWIRFWFAPINPIALHAVRVAVGLAFLAWLLPLAGQHSAFFGPDGWFDLRAYREAAALDGGSPKPIGWSLLYLAGGNPAAFTSLYWSSIGVLALFTLGIWPRLTSVLTWAIVLSFVANPATDIEAYTLFVPLATYVMVGYLLLGQSARGLSLASRLFGSVRLLRRDPILSRPSSGANLALRLLQIHLAILIVTSGLHKLQFGDWWSGVGLWYPLYPPLQLTAQALREAAEKPVAWYTCLSIATYVALACQIFFPAFAWRPRAWIFVPLGALVGCVATAVLYGDPLFGTALLAGSVAFVPQSAWQWLGARFKLTSDIAGREMATEKTGARRQTPDPRPSFPVEAGARRP